MNRKYFKRLKLEKCNMDKTIEFYNIINSVIIENEDYREIFNNATQFEYGGSLNEYYEKDINAIMVNNIRHNYSNYDQNLKLVRKIQRSDNDYCQYKNSVLDKIASAYPALECECNRQKRKLNMVVVCNGVG